MSKLTKEQQAQLERDGYLLFKHLLSHGERVQVLERLEELWQSEGEQAGAENYIEPGTRRLANLANKGEVFRPIFAHPLVLSAVAAVVGPDIHLSMLNARDVTAYAGHGQPLHCDVDDWEKPNTTGFNACTAVWMLDDFTRQNGATRLVPGSHHVPNEPAEVLADIFAPHPDEIVIEGQAGDVLVFNGHCWHAGGINHTNASRRAILAHYRRADIPLRRDRRQHLSPEVATRLTPLERRLLALS